MLYFVATPIGNLDDITLRALEVLRSVDIIAAEDTRHTAVLLHKYGITTRTVAYHKFNEKSAVGGIVDMLKSGKNVAVVSDAGMPMISDPGHILLDAAIEHGLEYTVVSGACAGVNAVALSGLDTRTFTLLGFLPEKNIDRRRFVEPYRNVPGTLVFYSAVHDIDKDLEFLYEMFGARKVAVCREMTKMFETVTRGVLGQSMEIVNKGEFAVVVEGAKPDFSDETVERHIARLVSGGDDVKTAVKKVAAERKIAKSEVYKTAVEMKNKGEL